jgi:hypothetical protein
MNCSPAAALVHAWVDLYSLAVALEHLEATSPCRSAAAVRK